MEAPFLHIAGRPDAPCWRPRCGLLALVVASGFLVGCETAPRTTSSVPAPVEVATEDDRLPNTADLALLSQIDGSGLAWDADQASSDPTPSAEPAESDSDVEADENDTAEETLILARNASSSTEPEAITLPVAALQSMLSELAATADDPTPYELAAALLPLVAVPELLEGAYPEYAPRIADLSSEEETLVLGSAEFASAVRRRIDAGETPAAVITSELERFQSGLRNDDGLRMPTVALCSAIRGFGDFDQMPDRLPTRVDRDALIYVALDGLDWQQLENGTHRWQVDHRIELRQLSDGFVVDPGRWAVQTHALPAPSRDAFFWVRIRLPISDLSAGRYALKVRVREPSSGREVDRSLDLELVPARLLTAAGDD